MAKPKRSRRAQRKVPPRPLWRRPWVLAAIAALVLLLVFLVPTLSDTKPKFDGERAYAEVVRQVEFGPRVPGTAAHDAARAYFVETLTPLADRVLEQTFTYTAPNSTTYTGTNVVASFNLDPNVGTRVLLAAHWDSRPRADRDLDPAKRDEPVLGANDGASGVAVLLEMARLLAAEPPGVGVDIVLFDLEDLGDYETADTSAARIPFALGSAAFVRDNPTYRPTFGILLDMVGGEDLRIPQEAYSRTNARAVVENHLGFDGRIAARIQNFTTLDINDFRHVCYVLHLIVRE